MVSIAAIQKMMVLCYCLLLNTNLMIQSVKLVLLDLGFLPFFGFWILDFALTSTKKNILIHYYGSILDLNIILSKS